MLEVRKGLDFYGLIWKNVYNINWEKIIIDIVGFYFYFKIECIYIGIWFFKKYLEGRILKLYVVWEVGVEGNEESFIFNFSNLEFFGVFYNVYVFFFSLKSKFNIRGLRFVEIYSNFFINVKNIRVFYGWRWRIDLVF